ncbi:hypothetical protein [Comamonas testosteroni]|uniref:hypothetical protein n=1 Tax=Comamonas testosteroni TaxID=285 RepID=UPI000AB3F1F6|nr:hypothetical protein [Comamonas testosteroni]
MSAADCAGNARSKARCVDANGTGYACKGDEAIMHGQSMHSGQQPKRQELKLDSATSGEEGRHMFARPSSGGSTHESMQKRLEQMDAAAAAARSGSGAGPRS